MNRLAPAPSDERDGPASEPAGDRYLLPAHAHLVVYERGDGDAQKRDTATRERGVDDAVTGERGVDDAAPSASAAEDSSGVSASETRGLITIYDCGAAQKPPSAQLLGVLGSVRAACETTRNPTGYVVRMREPSVLVDAGDGRFVVRER